MVVVSKRIDQIDEGIKDYVVKPKFNLRCSVNQYAFLNSGELKNKLTVARRLEVGISFDPK